MGITINRPPAPEPEPEGERPAELAGRFFIRDEPAFNPEEGEMAEESELVIYVDSSREKEVSPSKGGAIILRGEDAEKFREEHSKKAAKQVDNKAVENKDTK